MQETCQSGSEGGAKRTFVPTPILNVQVIRGYSWAATESPKNSQCKPVNNCGGSRDFPETLVSSLKRWQPATDCAADLLRMDLNDLSRRSSLQLIEQAGHASG
jgi:hypothetical protein